MEGLSSLNTINQENENKMNIYMFDNNFIFIIIIISIILIKIVNFVKNKEEKQKETIILSRKLNFSTYYINGLFEVKKISNRAIIKKDKKKLNNDNNKIKEYQIKKRMNIKNNNTIIRNYIIIILSILINMFYQIKNNIFDLFYFH